MSTQNGKGNAKAVAPNGKLPGGVTGKGFKPGQSGNPSGGRIAQKTRYQFGEDLRRWLQKQDWAQDALGNRIGGKGTGQRAYKEPRVQTVVRRLALTKPEVLLAYAYGKPVEAVELSQAEGAPIEFVVRVGAEDMP